MKYHKSLPTLYDLHVNLLKMRHSNKDSSMVKYNTMFKGIEKSCRNHSTFPTIKTQMILMEKNFNRYFNNVEFSLEKCS